MAILNSAVSESGGETPVQAKLRFAFSLTAVSSDDVIFLAAEAEAFFVPVIPSYKLQATDRKAHLVWL